MPGYKAHLAGGAVLSGAILAACIWLEFYEPQPLMAAALIAIAMMAALFPDTDTESKGQNFFYGLMAFTDLILLVNKEYEWAAILGLFAMLPAVGKHRGWTHTWWAMLIVPLPIIILPMAFFHARWEDLLPFYLAAVVGYLSHLALDREF